MIDFSSFRYHPVIELPERYEVYDFSAGYDANRALQSPFGIGKYDEDRRGMYTAELFQNETGMRTVHMGIDIGAPLGTPVRAFFAGEIFLFANNARQGDYGYTVITKHLLGGEPLYALFGHLSGQSLQGKFVGQPVQPGEVIAWIGSQQENGGWNPHLHLQLSLEQPVVCDMPGVVSLEQREHAKLIFPDPRLVLGPLY